MKSLNVNIMTRFEDDDTPVYQRVWSDDEPCIRYSVRNLCDCPRDACIHRDLIDAYEWLEAVELGMTLAHEGYFEIVPHDVEWKCED